MRIKPWQRRQYVELNRIFRIQMQIQLLHLKRSELIGRFRIIGGVRRKIDRFTDRLGNDSMLPVPVFPLLVMRHDNLRLVLAKDANLVQRHFFHAERIRLLLAFRWEYVQKPAKIG